MTHILTLVPKWVWAALASILVVVAGAWAHSRYVDGLVEKAVLAERTKWQDAHRQALAQAQIERLKAETDAAMAALEVQGELKQAQQDVAVARADLRAERSRLRNTIAEFRDRAIREAQDFPAGSVAHGAAVVAESLDECSSRYEAVAGVADELSVQVTGLQQYITRVVGPHYISGGPQVGPAPATAILD